MVKRVTHRRAATPRIARHTELLKQLATARQRIQHTTIRQAKKDLVLALVDCAQAIIKEKSPVNPDQYQALVRRSKDISDLIAPGVSLSTRKRVLQKGGFLTAMLGPLLGALF